MELVFIILFNIKHVILGQWEPVHGTVLVKPTWHAATRIQFRRRVETVIVLVVSIRVLVKVIKIGNIHSTLLTSNGALSSTVECAADSTDGASISLIHLRVSPRYAILDTLALRAWLSWLLSDGAHCVHLIRLWLVVGGVRPSSSVVVYVLHRLRADSYSWLRLQLQWNTLLVHVHPYASIPSSLSLRVLLLFGVADVRILLSCQTKASWPGHANQTFVCALLEHATVVRASFVWLLGLVDLHLLDSAKWVLGSRVAAPRSLRARYQVLSSTWLYVASCWQAITKSLWIEVCCCVMHILAASAILAGAHKLVVHASRASSSCLTTSMPCLSFFWNYSHPIEVVLGEIQIFSRLNLHILALVVIKW